MKFVYYKFDNRWRLIMSLEQLSDELILEAYYDAIRLKLQADFILILKQEILRRNIRFTGNRN